jgi:hypothetical protein
VTSRALLDLRPGVRTVRTSRRARRALTAGWIWGAALAAAMWFPAAGRAAFEIEALGPRERAVATRVALGMVPGSFSLMSLEAGPAAGDSSADLPEAGAPDARAGRLGAVSIYGFRPFGIGQIDFVSVVVALAAPEPVAGFVVAYQRLEALSYVEEACLVSAAFGSGGLQIQPAVTVGRVRDESGFGDWALVVDFSTRARVHGGLRITTDIKNPFGLGLVREGSRCPQRVAVGLGLPMSTSLACGVEVMKDSRFPTRVALGTEWTPCRGCTFRCGLKTDPEELCLGVGWRRGCLAVDLASSLDWDLGVTHEAGVTYLWR